MLVKLKEFEDNFIAIMQDPAIARLLTLVVAAAVVAKRVKPEWDWVNWVIEGGAALGIYGSIHRPNSDNPAADPNKDSGA